MSDHLPECEPWRHNSGECICYALEVAEQRGREDGIHKGRLMELADVSPFPLQRKRADERARLLEFIRLTNTRPDPTEETT